MDRINSRLEAIEKHIVDDKEDTKIFRDELKDHMKSQQTILLGDGEQKKGLVNRVGELETIRGLHSKFIWVAIPTFFSLAAKSLWDTFTRK